MEVNVKYPTWERVLLTMVGAGLVFLLIKVSLVPFTSGLKPGVLNYLVYTFVLVSVAYCVYLAIKRFQLTKSSLFNQQGIAASFALNGYSGEHIKFKKGFVSWSSINSVVQTDTYSVESSTVLKNKNYQALLFKTSVGELLVTEKHQGYSELRALLKENNVQIQKKT